MPVDSEYGEPLYAEVAVQGKRRQAITECALVACQLLHARGILRPGQGGEEGSSPVLARRKRSRRANGHTDDEDDVFFDRTGDVERTRARKRRRHEETLLTYDGVCHQLAELQQTLDDKLLTIAQLETSTDGEDAAGGQDSLDAFMRDVIVAERRSRLKQLRAELPKMREELAHLAALAEQLKPHLVPMSITQAAAGPAAAVPAVAAVASEQQATVESPPAAADAAVSAAAQTVSQTVSTPAFHMPRVPKDVGRSVSRPSPSSQVLPAPFSAAISSSTPPQAPRFPTLPKKVAQPVGLAEAAPLQKDEEDVQEEEESRELHVNEAVGGLIIRKVREKGIWVLRVWRKGAYCCLGE